MSARPSGGRATPSKQAPTGCRSEGASTSTVGCGARGVAVNEVMIFALSSPHANEEACTTGVSVQCSEGAAHEGPCSSAAAHNPSSAGWAASQHGSVAEPRHSNSIRDWPSDSRHQTANGKASDCATMVSRQNAAARRWIMVHRTGRSIHLRPESTGARHRVLARSKRSGTLFPARQRGISLSKGVGSQFACSKPVPIGLLQEARAKLARLQVKSERPGLAAGAFAFCGVCTRFCHKGLRTWRSPAVGQRQSLAGCLADPCGGLPGLSLRASRDLSAVGCLCLTLAAGLCL